ncbi:hypothetical protein [Clostridium sp.]|uniref:hypothetical protein n=1 Tax=Clostridium sp. TaxID=1506 RepID=UPI001B443F84|nr:hypothetical protein [Clostridium sp.]MBP3914593.1 hypothetical protein [Clostridium sp.]
MASKVTLYQNDNGIKLYINITKDGLIENISGAEIEFVLEGVQSGVRINKSTHAPHPQDVIEITDPEMAEICITLYSKDTEVIDIYNARITTIYSNGTKLTNDEFQYNGSKASFQIKQPKVDFEEVNIDN